MSVPILFLLALISSPQRGPVVPVGSIAPAFSVSDDRGAARSLAEFKGKYVVLEWHEKGCPYVAKHYKGGAMQRRQAEWMGRGVVWLLINSSTDGSHSYLTPETSREYFKSINTAPTAALLDTTGNVGKLYGVTTALHMVIIDPAGWADRLSSPDRVAARTAESPVRPARPSRCHCAASRRTTMAMIPSRRFWSITSRGIRTDCEGDRR